MALPSELNHEKLAEAAIALLSLTAANDHGAVRVWKGLDWDLMNLLHEKGWISNPVSSAKSVVMTDEGARRADDVLARDFRKRSF